MTEPLTIKKYYRYKNIAEPHYATSGSACFDIASAADEDIIIMPNQIQLIPTGLIFDLDDGWEAQIRPRSGLALKHGITVLNAPATIDFDYRKDVKVILINHSQTPFTVKPKTYIAQVSLNPIHRIKNLIRSDTRFDGFGSTDNNE